MIFMEETTLPKVATNIFVHCKKCDAERYHKVLAHTTTTTAKIACEVCGSKKSYKVPKVQERTKPTTPRLSKRAVNQQALESAQAEEFKKLKTKFKGVAPVAYNMSLAFQNDQVIEHPKFGLGFISKVMSNKVEVIFEGTVKELVHNRKV